MSDPIVVNMTGALDAAPLQDVRAALAGALFDFCSAVMSRSQEDFCPVKEGILRGSGHVEEPVDSGTEIVCTMAYGGPAEAYAIVQHERLDFHHTVGQAKYLEIPVLESATHAAEDIAQGARNRLGL